MSQLQSVNNLNTLGSLINSASNAVPNDTDVVATVESSVIKKITWTNVKAFLKTYFDAIYTTASAVSSQISSALAPYLTSATAAATYQPIITYITGTAVLSFPTTYEDSFAITTVTNTSITNALVKSVSFIPLVSANHDSLDDFQWDGLTFNIENIVDGVSFDIRATASNNTWGDYNVKYLIQI